MVKTQAKCTDSSRVQIGKVGNRSPVPTTRVRRRLGGLRPEMGVPIDA